MQIWFDLAGRRVCSGVFIKKKKTEPEYQGATAMGACRVFAWDFLQEPTVTVLVLPRELRSLHGHVTCHHYDSLIAFFYPTNKRPDRISEKDSDTRTYMLDIHGPLNTRYSLRSKI